MGQIFVEFRCTADRFAADLKQMSRDAKEFEGTLKPIRDQVLNLGAGLTAAGAAIGGTLLLMAKQAADFGGAIHHAAVETGITTERLSTLKFAADQTGTSFEDVNKALIKLAKSALGAATGSKEQAAAFAAISVSVKDTSGHLRPMDELLNDVADRFSRMKDGTEKAALAQRLFGRNGAEMIGLLNQGKAGLDAFGKSAGELHVLVGEEAAQAAAKFNHSLKELDDAELGLSQTIGQALLPSLTELAEIATGVTKKFSDFAAAHPRLIQAAAALAAVLVGSGGLLLGLAGVLTILPKVLQAIELLQFALAGALGPIGLVVLAIGALATAFVVFPKFREVVIDYVIKPVVAAFAGLISILGSAASTLYALAQGKFKEAASVVGASYTKMKTDAMGAADGVAGSINGLVESFNGLASTTPLWQGPLKPLKPLLGEAGDAAEAFAKQVKGLVTSVTKENDELRALGLALTQLDAKHISSTAITDKLGKKIIEVTKEAQMHGEAIPPIVQHYADLAKQQEFVIATSEELKKKFTESQIPLTALIPKLALLNGQMERKELVALYAQEIVKAGEAQVAAGQAIPDFLNGLYAESKAFVDATTKVKDYNAAILLNTPLAELSGPTVSHLTVAPPIEIPNIQVNPKLRTDLEDIQKRVAAASNEIGHMRALPEEVAQSVQRLRDAGYSNAEIIEVMGSDIRKAGEVARDLKVPLDEGTKAILRQAEAAEEAKKRAEDWRRAWSTAVGNITSQFADGVANMIFDGKKFSLSITSIFKDLGKSLVKILVTEAFTSIAKGFLNMIEGKGGILDGFKMIKDAGKDAAGAIKNLTGNGDSAAWQGPRQQGGGGGESSSSKLGGDLNVVKAGLDIANSAVDLYNKTIRQIGAGRRAANEIVKAQNAFTKAAVSVEDDPTLTAKQKLDLVNAMWADYQKNLDRFSASSPSNAKVANQSYATLDPFITDIQKNLMGWVSKQAAANPNAGVNGKSGLDFSGFDTVVGKFREAVDVFAKAGVLLPAASDVALPPPVAAQDAIASPTRDLQTGPDSRKGWGAIAAKLMQKRDLARGIATPAASAAGHAMITVENSPTFTFTIEGGSEDMRRTFRDEILPEFVEALKLNTAGLTQKIAETVKQAWPGIVTVPNPAS